MKDRFLLIKDKISEGIRKHKEIVVTFLVLAGIICFFLFNDFQSKEDYYDITLNTVEKAASDKETEDHEKNDTGQSDKRYETLAEENHTEIEENTNCNTTDKLESSVEESGQGTESKSSGHWVNTDETTVAFETTEDTGVTEAPSVTEQNHSEKETTGKSTHQSTTTPWKTETASETDFQKPETTEAVTTTKNEEPEETTADTITVFFSIDCKNILNHLDDLKDYDSLKDYIGNGIILDKTGYQISAGSTVFDLLELVTRANRIQLDYQGASSNIYGTVYVRGIQYIYEKSCGTSSGWMYTVNGEWVGVGCSSKKLEDGDFVQWRFTCNGGSDLKGN